MQKLITKQELIEEIKKASKEELSYIIGRYCGPHNVLLASKRYTYDACKILNRLANDEFFTREFENCLTDALLSND